MRYLLFGTGDYYERYKKWFSNDEIIALLDNSELKQGTYIDGKQVLSPFQGIKLDYDAIVILSFYVKAMKQQLLELGVDESCIYHFFDLHKIFCAEAKVIDRQIHYYGNAEKALMEKQSNKKRIYLLSHDLTLGGPALALYHVAEVLCNNGYEVIFVSMLDGELRKKLNERNIPVVVDENLQIETMQQSKWRVEADLILCNTISYYIFLSERNVETPIIWWLHDSSFFYDGVDEKILKEIDRRNLSVVSVGTVPRKAMQDFLPDLEIEDLLYGVSDEEVGRFKVTGKEKKIRFLTIGYIENRKGQDILLKAIKQLSEEILKKCEFFLVGQKTSLLAQHIQKEIYHIPEVIMTGCVDRTEIHDLLSNADVLVCPSREDPMPTVAAEAMMHSVPCIVSDVTGTAAYIQNNEDGFIFESENVQELAEKIEWCVKNRNELRHMGQRARKIYEKVFSMRAFEERLMEIVDEMLD